MADEEHPRLPRSYSRLTVITVLLLVAVGAAIVIIDRKQVALLMQTSDWSYLIGAVAFTGLSYLAGSATFLVIMRIFKNRLGIAHLLNIGMVSMVLQNLIGPPSGMSVRILLLGRHGVKNSEIVASSLLLSYFKNLFYFSLIPISLIWIVVSHPLPAFGAATILLIIAVLIVLLVVASSIAFYARLRAFVLRGIGRAWRKVIRRDIQKHLDQFSASLTLGTDNLRRKKENRLPLAVTIVVDVGTTMIALWFCFAALGIPVDPWALFTAFNFGITLTIISFIPGDIGVQEASMAGAFALFGVPFSQGVIAAVLFRVVYYFVPFILTLPLYWKLLREKVADVKSEASSAKH
jgi:uncharacterized protein (TIRG00374 family)